jgi:hypothetical protein
LLWAIVMRRGDLVAIRHSSSQGLLDGFYLAVLPLPFAHALLLLLPVASSDPSESAQRATFIIFAGLVVLSTCLVRNYRSGNATFAALYGGTFLAVLGIGLHDLLAQSISRSGIGSSESIRFALIVATLVVAFGVVARRTRDVQVATLLIVATPSLLLYLAFALIQLQVGAHAVMASLLTSYPIYRYGMVPLITVLEAGRHGHPQPPSSV